MEKQNNRKGINAMDNRFEITKGLTAGINTRHNPSVIAKGLTAGITLIALVITIIIILILAGISISGLAGDNGLIAKTISAKEEAKISELQEKLELKKIEYVIDKNKDNIDLNEYIAYIIDKKLIDNKDVSETGEENSKYVTLEDKYVFLVEKILETGELKITYQGKVGKLKPIIVNIEVLEKNTNSIKVQVNTRLTKNATYTYYIAEEDEEYKKKDKIDSNIYEYTELKQGKKYKIKVEVEIKDGGKTYSEINIETIDNLAPTSAIITAGEVTSSKSVKLTAIGTDEESGIDSYTIYVNGTAVSLNNNIYTINNMVFNKEYNCYVIVKDKAGNTKTSDTITVKNEKYISNAEDLKELATAVNNGNNFSEKTIIQTDNIELECSNSNQWEPIGNNKTDLAYFSGIYDGQNKSISGIYINNTSNYQGLFGELKNATIKNLGVINGTVKGKVNIGSIAGVSRENTIIQNCYNTMLIQGDSYVGGINGNNINSIIQNCYNMATIKCNLDYVGGISAQNYGNGIIKQCYNTGEIINYRR